MTWATLPIGAKIGIIMAIFIVVMILMVGYFTEWKFKCFQRLPHTGQSWS